MSKTFMLEFTLTHPDGERIEDWGMLGHSFADIREDHVALDLADLCREVTKMISDFSRTKVVDEPTSETQPMF